MLERKIVRCIELKLSGKPFPLYIDHAGFAVNPERYICLQNLAKTDQKKN